MQEKVIRFDNVKKEYRLGQLGSGTLYRDLQSWMAHIRRKEDPNKKIQANTELKGERFMALNGISFEVKKGEALGIIGHNGAGKSTLLKLLCRVTAPTEGTISYNGRITSMLEVGTGFNGEMTGRENVYMNGAILGMTKAEIDSKIDEIIEFSEVGEFIDTPVKRYSSGMYVKLAFSVAAHLDSEIMIMDEVLAVGDMAFQKKCLDKMRDAATKEGRTVLYVSHNMNTIRQLCDRCIVLDKGQIIFDGDVEDAVAVYMQSSDNQFFVNVDLDKQIRMKHLPKEPKAKIIRLKVVGKEYPVFEINERINFELTFKVNEDVFHPCVRFEIRAFDGTSVGVAFLHNMNSFESNTISCVQFSADFHGLIEGKYRALLVVYEANEFGGYDDYDAVWPAFNFEICDTQDKTQIRWNQSAWGKIKFPDLVEERRITL